MIFIGSIVRRFAYARSLVMKDEASRTNTSTRATNKTIIVFLAIWGSSWTDLGAYSILLMGLKTKGGIPRQSPPYSGGKTQRPSQSGPPVPLSPEGTHGDIEFVL